MWTLNPEIARNPKKLFLARYPNMMEEFYVLQCPLRLSFQGVPKVNVSLLSRTQSIKKISSPFRATEITFWKPGPRSENRVPRSGNRVPQFGNTGPQFGKLGTLFGDDDL